MRSASLVFALFVTTSAFAFTTGCSATTESSDDESTSALGALPTGVSNESAEGEGVRMLANDRRVGAEIFVTRTGLTRAVADAIVAGRTDRNGAPRWYRDAEDVLHSRVVSTHDIELLVRDAVQNDYVEKPGFDDQVLARLSVPDGVATPREADVTVEKGLDGLSPDEAVALVKSRVRNVIDPRNTWVDDTIRRNHKAFTLAAWNLLGPGTPPAAFARGLHADRLTVLGTMSAMMPTILLAEVGDLKVYYARGSQGTYERLPKAPAYPVIMRARVRIAPAPPGIRVFYPDWSAPVLAGETGGIFEER